MSTMSLCPAAKHTLLGKVVADFRLEGAGAAAPTKGRGSKRACGTPTRASAGNYSVVLSTLIGKTLVSGNGSVISDTNDQTVALGWTPATGTLNIRVKTAGVAADVALLDFLALSLVFTNSTVSQ